MALIHVPSLLVLVSICNTYILINETQSPGAKCLAIYSVDVLTDLILLSIEDFYQISAN